MKHFSGHSSGVKRRNKRAWTRNSPLNSLKPLGHLIAESIELTSASEKPSTSSPRPPFLDKNQINSPAGTQPQSRSRGDLEIHHSEIPSRPCIRSNCQSQRCEFWQKQRGPSRLPPLPVWQPLFLKQCLDIFHRYCIPYPLSQEPSYQSSLKVSQGLMNERILQLRVRRLRLQIPRMSVSPPIRKTHSICLRETKQLAYARNMNWDRVAQSPILSAEAHIVLNSMINPKIFQIQDRLALFVDFSFFSHADVQRDIVVVYLHRSEDDELCNIETHSNVFHGSSELRSRDVAAVSGEVA